MTKPKRVALYVRVSTGEQTTANQIDELKAWAKRAGNEIGKVYEDKGLSGAKGRDKRPAFDVPVPRARLTPGRFQMMVNAIVLGPSCTGSCKARTGARYATVERQR